MKQYNSIKRILSKLDLNLSEMFDALSTPITYMIAGIKKNYQSIKPFRTFKSQMHVVLHSAQISLKNLKLLCDFFQQKNYVNLFSMHFLAVFYFKTCIINNKLPLYYV